MKKILLSLTLFTICAFVAAPRVEAKVIVEKNTTYTLSVGETVPDDLFVGAQSSDIAGTVNGNLYVGSSTVTLTGIVSGDVFVGAGNVDVSGAKIGGSLHLGAGQATLDKGTTIGGSLLAAGGMVRDQATVGRNAFLAGGNLVLDGKVGKEARLAGGTITLGPSANVAGDLTYVLDKNQSNFTQSATATVAGTVAKVTPPAVASSRGTELVSALGKAKTMLTSVFTLVGYFSGLLMGLLLLRLLPNWSQGVAISLRSKTLKYLGLGFLGTLVIFPAVAILMLTVVGIPLALLSFALFLTSLYLAKLVVGYAVGGFIAARLGWKKLSPYAVFGLGFTVYFLLHFVPFVGGLFALLAVIAGLGAILASYARAVGK